jgi:hypothetical protein
MFHMEHFPFWEEFHAEFPLSFHVEHGRLTPGLMFP